MDRDHLDSHMPTGMRFARRPRPPWSQAPPRTPPTHIKPLGADGLDALAERAPGALGLAERDVNLPLGG